MNEGQTTSNTANQFEVAPGIGYHETGDGQGNHWFNDNLPGGRRWFACRWHAEQAETTAQERAIAVAEHNDNVPDEEEVRP